MANELRSTFLRSKMNKDLDARIVPPGEYRDGENIAISRSEGADVGALENVLGNKLISDFNITEIGVETIGMCTDNGNNRIFLFMTNYTDTSSTRLDNRASKEAYCAIFVYNFNDENFETLVEGSFLNFSKTHPIYGVNLLEDLLFWTDDRNQPRRIDISKALNAPATSPNPYYQIEENVSVAKYYPFSTPQTYEEITVTVKARTQLLIDDGSTLNAGFGPIAPSINAVGTPPVDYPQTKFNTICEIQGDLPNIKLHPGLKFYIKSSTPDPTYGPLDRFTTWPYYNEIKNYPIEWAMQSLHGGAPTPFPWPMYSMTGIPPDPQYCTEPGYTDRWMTVSKEYASNPEALYRANNGTHVDICDGSGAGVTQDLPSLDYQENYLKWFYPNIPFLDGDTGDEWHGTAELVFVVPKLRNKVDRWLPSTYRVKLVDIEKADDLLDLPYAPNKGLCSNGQQVLGFPGIGLGAVNPGPQWLPRNTLGATNGINEAWLQNEMVLDTAVTPNTIDCLTEYQKSVSLGLFKVTLGALNGYGIGPQFATTPASGANHPLRTYAKWYLQPGMKVDCPIFLDDNITLVIDQIFPNGAFPTNIDDVGQFMFSVHGEDRDGNFLPYWFTPDMTQYLDNIYFDLSFPNPYYEKDFGGDTFYLDEKFCRLAHRYKFESGEYSLISPFTQCLFKPKKEGYYLKDMRKWDYDSGGVAFFAQGDSEPTSDIENVSQTTLNPTYENSLDEIQILIESPVIGVDNIPFNEIGDKLKIESLEIIFNESDSTNLRVLKSIPVTDSTITSNATSLYTYTWDGDKPFSTLPDKETTRVFDKVPIKALAQEIAGNRVIYGNFVNRHSSPEFLDYSVGVTRKYPINEEFTNFSTESYPNHTLKQNRSYQVGIVLADKYGRQSDVILAPSEISTTELNTELFSGDTFKATYLTMEEAVDTIPEGRNITDWVGNSLKILFNEVIPSEVIGLEGYPGLYTDEGGVSEVNLTSPGAGYETAKNLPTITTSGSGEGLTIDIVDDGAGIIDTIFINQPGQGYEIGDTVQIDQDGNVTATLEILEITAANPLGWYSYKIVVKQQEQDYYNLYVPQILNGEPLENYVAGAPPLPFLDSKFVAVTIGDNVNKIPREVNESNELVSYVSSNTKLFPRVSQFGGVGREWSLWGSSTWAFSSGISTGNVFNNENPDGVINLGAFNNIYSDSATTPTFEVYEYILYKQQDNPYITIATNSVNRNPFLLPWEFSDAVGGLAEFYQQASVDLNGMITPSGVGQAYYSSAQSAVSMGAFNSGIGVIETSPFVSEIDIFYETSTSGKINDLNYLIQTNVDENIPFSLRIDTADFDEYTEPLYWALWAANALPAPTLPILGADPWINTITPKNAAGQTIPLIKVVSIAMSVVDGVGTDRTTEFVLSNNASGTSEYGIYLKDDGLPYFEAPSQTHNFTFQITLETLAELPGDPNHIKTFNFSRNYGNKIPYVVSSGSNPRDLPGGPPNLTSTSGVQTGIVWGMIVDYLGIPGNNWGSNLSFRNGAFRTNPSSNPSGFPGLGDPEYTAQQLKWVLLSCINQTTMVDYVGYISFNSGINGAEIDTGGGIFLEWQNQQKILVESPLPVGDYIVKFKVTDANDNDADGGQLTYEYDNPYLTFTIDP